MLTDKLKHLVHNSTNRPQHLISHNHHNNDYRHSPSFSSQTQTHTPQHYIKSASQCRWAISASSSQQHRLVPSSTTFLVVATHTDSKWHHHSVLLVFTAMLPSAVTHSTLVPPHQLVSCLLTKNPYPPYDLKHPDPVHWEKFKTQMEIWLAAESNPDAQQWAGICQALCNEGTECWTSWKISSEGKQSPDSVWRKGSRQKNVNGQKAWNVLHS